MARQKESSLFNNSFFKDFYDIAAVVVFVGGAYYLYKNTDVGDQLRSLFDNALSKIPNRSTGGGGTAGGGGTITGVGGGALSAGNSWNSAAWGNGKARTINGCHRFDPYDRAVEVAADGCGPWTVDGKGNSILSGNQGRLYIHANNYNGKIVLDGAWANGSGVNDNYSLRLRSRHNAGGAPSNRFGGYGVSFDLSGKISFQREDYHDASGGVHVNFGGSKVSAFQTGKFYNLGFTVSDTSNGILQEAYVGGKLVARGIDRKPLPYMHNKSLVHYAWIRHNAARPFTFRNASVGNL